MRALVTGAGGFVGQWLCRALLRDGWDVAGLTLDGEPAGGILSADERRGVQWHAADLAESPETAELEGDPTDALLGSLLAQRPDAVFHLAGIALQSTAARDVDRAYAVNVGSAMRLMRAVAQARMADAADPMLLVVGSAEQYGAHSVAEMPLSETASCDPKTVYGQTKQTQEQAAIGFAQLGAARVIATRSFNHAGPGQGPDFLLPSLVARAKAARAAASEVSIGNTDVIRDFLHVEDVVTAYISLVSHGSSGEVYNVCSGVGVRVGELAQEVLAAAGVRAPLKVDPALQRAVDVPALVGDNSKLRRATGWTPQHSRSRIISDLLDAAS